MPQSGARVSLVVYDVQGRVVRTLVDGAESAGAKSISWDGRDHRGQRVASGMYFYRLESSGKTFTKKMTLVE